MNRNLHSPTKLTEFARNFDEEPETIFTKFVNKLTSAYNSNYNHLNVISPTTSSSSSSTIIVPQVSITQLPEESRASTPSLNNSIQSDSSESKNDENPSPKSSSKENSPDNPGDRTQTGVFQRISNLVAMRSNVSFEKTKILLYDNLINN